MAVDPIALTEEFLRRLGFEAKVTAHDEDGGLLLEIETEDAEPLIGRDGRTLLEMQYLVNRMIYTQDRDHPRVSLDVGHFRSQRRETLEAEAHAAAEKVRRWGDIVELAPMNAFDRWVIHNALKDDPKVETHSIEVEGTSRKVIILRPRRD
ncbi:MAG: single-stranded DNA-binding protein [Verrucomicrobiales bacterium]|nr:single-stranded DNA-binding protein [Verrucomicrobiales bacterium]